LFPKIFSIGTFFLPTYGVLVALGFLAGLWITVKIAKKNGLDPEKVTNLAVYVALAGLIGAKLLMIAFDWPDIQIFSLSTLQAAGVFQGGLILALITAFFYIRHNKLPVLTTADAFAPGVALGHAIGRLGCFAAGCCWGKECHLPWAVTFRNPDAYALTNVPLNVPLHPAQLYESASEALLFAFLYWRSDRPHSPLKPGHSLPVRPFARIPVSRIKLRQFLPFQQCVGGYANGPRRFFEVALSQQSGDSLFFLPPEFAAVAFHLTQSDAICASASPGVRQRRFDKQAPCFSSRSE
jgi:phosphatidylglycerol---prolipoprotein diacylglyceryl transferase